MINIAQKKNVKYQKKVFSFELHYRIRKYMFYQFKNSKFIFIWQMPPATDVGDISPRVKLSLSKAPHITPSLTST